MQVHGNACIQMYGLNPDFACKKKTHMQKRNYDIEEISPYGGAYNKITNENVGGRSTISNSILIPATLYCNSIITNTDITIFYYHILTWICTSHQKYLKYQMAQILKRRRKMHATFVVCNVAQVGCPFWIAVYLLRKIALPYCTFVVEAFKYQKQDFRSSQELEKIVPS